MSELLFQKAKSNLAYSQNLRDTLNKPQPMDFGALQMQQEPIAPDVPPSFPRAQSQQLPQMQSQAPLLSSNTPTTPDWNSYQNKNTPLQNAATQGRLPMTQQIARGVSNLFQSFRPKTQGEARDMGLVGADPTAPYDAPTLPGQALIDATGFAGPMKAVGGVTLKSLKALASEVKTPTVAKQFLLDLSNRAELKQPERDLLRKFIDEEGDVVDVANFSSKVKSELLPLTTGKPSDFKKGLRDGEEAPQTWYENVVLPDEQRGPIANYSERIYQSPISTSAGDVHFQKNNAPNYFAHTRIEDLPMRGDFRDIGGGRQTELLHEKGDTRRVIEIQSDLFQKGRLEGEMRSAQNYTPSVSSMQEFLPKSEWETLTKIQKKVSEGIKKLTLEEERTYDRLWEKGIKSYEDSVAARNTEVAKLEPYRNTWWERIVREEVKQAAKDGKTKLQFPTGETAMKIEGLGSGEVRWTFDNQGPATPSELKVGKEIWESEPGIGMTNEDAPWIITDVLGDGKFKAVPKHLKEKSDADLLDDLQSYAETFDISGKVDTNHGVYRRYEKNIGPYLMKKYGGKVVTDPQGVKWIELDVPKDAAKLPVEAFGAGALGASVLDQED